MNWVASTWAFVSSFIDPVTPKHFQNLESKIVFCTIMRDERRMSDYTEGKLTSHRHGIKVASMYRNLSGFRLQYRHMSDFKELKEEHKVTVTFKYRGQLVLLESYFYKVEEN